jgi:uncharacterized protein
MILFKNFDTKMVDLDEKNMKVKVGISTVNYKDSDGDIILKSAYTKTLSENGPNGSKRIKHLKQHSTDQVIGRPLSFDWDGDTLFAISEISNSTIGKDAIEDYKLDLYEHSIGYQPLLQSFDKKADANIITELKMWEYSSVTWGANDKSPFMGFVKSLEKTEQINKVNQRMEKLINALRKGHYTDEKFEMIDLELTLIKQFYNELISLEPVKPTPSATLLNEEPIKQINLSTLKDSLKWN